MEGYEQKLSHAETCGNKKTDINMKCPNCNSKDIDLCEKDYSTAGSIIGGILDIGAALLTGGMVSNGASALGEAIGSDLGYKYYECPKCKYTWKEDEQEEFEEIENYQNALLAEYSNEKIAGGVLSLICGAIVFGCGYYCFTKGFISPSMQDHSWW